MFQVLRFSVNNKKKLISIHLKKFKLICLALTIEQIIVGFKWSSLGSVLRKIFVQIFQLPCRWRRSSFLSEGWCQNRFSIHSSWPEASTFFQFNEQVFESRIQKLTLKVVHVEAVGDFSLRGQIGIIDDWRYFFYFLLVLSFSFYTLLYERTAPRPRGNQSKRSFPFVTNFGIERIFYF